MSEIGAEEREIGGEGCDMKSRSGASRQKSASPECGKVCDIVDGDLYGCVTILISTSTNLDPGENENTTTVMMMMMMMMMIIIIINNNNTFHTHSVVNFVLYKLFFIVIAWTGISAKLYGLQSSLSEQFTPTFGISSWIGDCLNDDDDDDDDDDDNDDDDDDDVDDDFDDNIVVVVVVDDDDDDEPIFKFTTVFRSHTCLQFLVLFSPALLNTDGCFSQRVYSYKIFYIWAAFSNLVGRCAWAITITPHGVFSVSLCIEIKFCSVTVEISCQGVPKALSTTAMAVIELLRRAQW
eukprot:149733-Hanusia_phi.AAC.1